MQILKTGVAGTLESGDIFVEIQPAASVEIELESTVKSLYGRRIREVIEQTLSGLGVEKARVNANDKGALDCTIEARVKAAALRAAEQTADWSADGRRK